MKGSDIKRSKDIKEMSIYEASDFWDEHDFGEFDDVEEIKDVKFLLNKKKYVGIDMGLYSRIKRRAKKLHKAEDVLINEWLKEKVNI